MRQHRGEDGISEVVGAMLLVGVTVLAVVIVAVVLLSGYQPDEVPRAAIVAGNESGRLALVHEGGDPLRAGEYRIYVDNESGLADGTDDFIGLEDGAWSIGGVLTYTGGANPTRVIVTAVAGGSETILAEVAFRGGGKTFSPDPTEPGAGTVSANFTANVTYGPAPLAVRFTDTSTGGPTAWLWDFGDGNTSTVQNPIHTYTTPGTYTVSLTVTRAGASDTETKTGYITVTVSSTGHDALLNTAVGKTGTLMPGGYLEFKVTGAYSYVEIGGTRYDLTIGDTVKLVIGTSGRGEIYMSGSTITTFAYDDVTLYINDGRKGTAKINGIYIQSHEDLVSTLTLNVPSNNMWTRFTVDDETIIDGDDDREITLYNLMPGTDGLMNLNNGQETIYFVGSITNYIFYG